MSYAIIGFGKIGQALAHAFARKKIDVTVASRRPPEALAPQARAIGPTVVATSLRDAIAADTIFLAMPFGEYREVAKALPSWAGKTIIDATNAFPVPEELAGVPASAAVAKAFAGAKLVKGFNHLGAAHPGRRSERRGRPPRRLPVERRRGRDRSRGGPGQAARLRTRRSGQARRGWRAGARPRPHLGPADLPGPVQEGAVIAVDCRGSKKEAAPGAGAAKLSGKEAVSQRTGCPQPTKMRVDCLSTTSNSGYAKRRPAPLIYLPPSARSSDPKLKPLKTSSDRREARAPGSFPCSASRSACLTRRAAKRSCIDASVSFATLARYGMASNPSRLTAPR